MSISSLDEVLCPTYLRALCHKCTGILEQRPELLRDVHALASEQVDPLQVFLQTEVDKNHRRLITFIVWMSRRSDAYRHYRRILLQESDSCVQSLLRLALE